LFDSLLLAKNTRSDGRWNIRLLDWLFGYLGFVDLLFVATKSGDFVELDICLWGYTFMRLWGYL